VRLGRASPPRPLGERAGESRRQKQPASGLSPEREALHSPAPLTRSPAGGLI
jgi:hypothetical protein